MWWPALAEVLWVRLPPQAAAWLRAALDEAAGGPRGGFTRRWSEAGRRLGRAPMALAAHEVAALCAAGAPVPTAWGHDECGRAVLLARALEGLDPGRHVEWVETLYLTGDLRECQAVLRILGYLPEPARLVHLAREGVRSNAVALLEAVTCENPFPARFLDEAAFSQMVLKALFYGLALGRVEGLISRRSPELERQVEAYARERRLAGRPVPGDVELVSGGGTGASV